MHQTQTTLAYGVVFTRMLGKWNTSP